MYTIARHIFIAEWNCCRIMSGGTMEQGRGDRRVLYLLAVIGFLAVALVTVLLAIPAGGAPAGEANATMVPSAAMTGSTTASGISSRTDPTPEARV